MDTTIAGVIIVFLFFIIVIVALYRYPRRGKMEIKGPFGTSLNVEGDNATETKLGIKAKGVTSRKGGITAKESTGSGIDLEDLDANQDVFISSSDTSKISTQPSFQEPLHGALNAQSLNAGGNITIQQFVGDQSSLAQQLAFFIENVGLSIPQSDFEKSQFEAYTEVWRSLQALRLAGDDLWMSANENNLLLFAEQLRETAMVVREDEIFFEENDRNSLLDVLQEFSNYHHEKTSLIEMREWHLGKERYSVQKIQEQMLKNGQLKQMYEEILGNIRRSFNNKLST